MTDQPLEPRLEDEAAEAVEEIEEAVEPGAEESAPAPAHDLSLIHI